MRVIILDLVSFILVFVTLSASQNESKLVRFGRINGTVLSESGAPLADMKVLVVPDNGRIDLSAIRNVRSDKEGRFAMEKLKWGRYRLYATDEKGNYPDTTFAFYAQDEPPAVDLGPSTPEESVLLKVGPKAGAITGEVIDKISREPINATFGLPKKTILLYGYPRASKLISKC